MSICASCGTPCSRVNLWAPIKPATVGLRISSDEIMLILLRELLRCVNMRQREGVVADMGLLLRQTLCGPRFWCHQPCQTCLHNGLVHYCTPLPLHISTLHTPFLNFVASRSVCMLTHLTHHQTTHPQAQTGVANESMIEIMVKHHWKRWTLTTTGTELGHRGRFPHGKLLQPSLATLIPPPPPPLLHAPHPCTLCIKNLLQQPEFMGPDPHIKYTPL